MVGCDRIIRNKIQDGKKGDPPAKLGYNNNYSSYRKWGINGLHMAGNSQCSILLCLLFLKSSLAFSRISGHIVRGKKQVTDLPPTHISTPGKMQRLNDHCNKFYWGCSNSLYLGLLAVIAALAQEPIKIHKMHPKELNMSEDWLTIFLVYSCSIWTKNSHGSALPQMSCIPSHSAPPARLGNRKDPVNEEQMCSMASFGGTSFYVHPDWYKVSSKDWSQEPPAIPCISESGLAKKSFASFRFFKTPSYVCWFITPIKSTIYPM